jgi:hypothetical protein
MTRRTRFILGGLPPVKGARLRPGRAATPGHALLLGLALAIGIALAFGAGSCSTEPEVDGHGIPAASSNYIVLAWNDLGMHCLNPTYDEAVLLPPYNTVWAQVIRRGNPPQIVTEGLTAEYSIVANTTSYGKTDTYGAVFAGFWDNAATLFGVSLAQDTGLNLEDPGIHNGLSGTMIAKGDHFQVNGIPVTPVNDADAWSPYQVIEVTIKDGATQIARTRATVPTSDEIHCSKCHTQSGETVFHNVLRKHDSRHETQLLAETPILCARCHGSPALGTSGAGTSGLYLSQAIHGAHADRGATCYDCHPGEVTRCNRSLAHTADDGHCTTCHGEMGDVASSIESGTRVPWVNEPECATCHTDVTGVDTGATLYRNAAGHGGVYCAGCHNSPHAMHPSREAADRYQPMQYQQKSLTLGSCAVCHDKSRGEGASEFGEQHGGSGGGKTACHVCHTSVPTNTGSWPHAFQWKAR